MKHCQKICILIVGMHRSGTSAITRVMNLLGADIDSNLLVASDDNVSGYWESVDLYMYHEYLLERIGVSWSSAMPMPEDWIRNPEYNEALKFIKEYIGTHFDDSMRFVIKDPRLARLLRLWVGVLLELKIDTKVIIPYRNPSEVIISLNKRETENTLHSGKAFSDQYAGLLWLRYVLESEKYSRGLRRSFVGYHSLLKDWRHVSKKIGVDLAINWNPNSRDYEEQIDSFVRPDLYHSKYVINSEVRQSLWLSDAFNAIQMLEEDPYKPAAIQILDGINDELARADSIFTEIIKESEDKAKDLKIKEEKNQQRITDLQSKLANIEHERSMAMQDSFQKLRLERYKLLAQVQVLLTQVASLTQENESLNVSNNSKNGKSQTKHE